MNTNSPLTFGKYSGWTPADLAKAGSSGRSYLSWGANNLKSPAWRQVFEDALGETSATDLHLAARALVVADPGIGYDEALRFVTEEEEERAESFSRAAAHDEKRQQIAEKWGKVLGTPASRLLELGKREETGDWREIPQRFFSSPSAHEGFMSFMAEFVAVEW